MSPEQHPCAILQPIGRISRESPGRPPPLTPARASSAQGDGSRALAALSAAGPTTHLDPDEGSSPLPPRRRQFRDPPAKAPDTSQGETSGALTLILDGGSKKNRPPGERFSLSAFYCDDVAARRRNSQRRSLRSGARRSTPLNSRAGFRSCPSPGRDDRAPPGSRDD